MIRDPVLSFGVPLMRVFLSLTTLLTAMRTYAPYVLPGLFFEIDLDSSLYIERDECDLFLSFAALDLSAKQRGEIFTAYDFVVNGKLNRMEFLTLCRDVLWEVPGTQLEAAVVNMQQTRNAQTNRNRAYWQALSARLDSTCRVVVPPIYILCQVVLFNLNFDDNYGVNMSNPSSTSTVSMFEGFAPHVWLSERGSVMLIVYLLLVLFCGLMWAVGRAYSARRQAKLDERQREAVHASVASIERARPSVGLWEPRMAATKTHMDDTMVSPLTPRDQE